MDYEATTDDTDTDDRTEDLRCGFCNRVLASDGDCDACQAAWERGGQL